MQFLKWILCSSISVCIGYYAHYASVPNNVTPVVAEVIPKCSDEKISVIKSYYSSSSNVIKNRQVILSGGNSSSASSASSNLLPQNEELENAKNKLLSLELNQFMNRSDGGKTFSEKLDSKFKDEDVDVGWAETQERVLSDLFIDNKNLAGIALKNMQCRTNQCRLVVAATDLNGANTNFETLLNALREKNSGAQVLASPDVQQNMTTLYISREGRSFEFN